MKRLVLAILATCGCAGLAVAQDSALNLTTSGATSTHRFTAAGEGINLVTSVTGDTIAVPVPTANPSPQPEPRFYFGNNDDYRFQLGVGYTYVRFRSTPFNANLNGLHTSLSYFLNDWFAVEGNVVAAFGTEVFAADRSKYLLYTGGGRIAWRDPKHKYEPWMHGLVGGLHMIPQTALGGKNGFALQAGGGVDVRFNSRLSFRLEGDYVRSQLYSQTQNSFQFGGGAVIHF
ncbi:MAG: hypothetical protein JSS69_00605 [Acidobacteria bacterium]|nr:hypothetical protein [Acidobacteriota bacterium]MBS1864393.1 hypothetical protein [Acidobacteriota bacterium]